MSKRSKDADRPICRWSCGGRRAWARSSGSVSISIRPRFATGQEVIPCSSRCSVAVGRPRMPDGQARTIAARSIWPGSFASRSISFQGWHRFRSR